MDGLHQHEAASLPFRGCAFYNTLSTRTAGNFGQGPLLLSLPQGSMKQLPALVALLCGSPLPINIRNGAIHHHNFSGLKAVQNKSLK